MLEEYFDVHHRTDAEGPCGDAPVTVPLRYKEVGGTFPLMNRDDACKDVLVAFDNLRQQQLDAKRAPTRNANDEAFKITRPTLPYCSGMPGMGKTRFVREAASHLMRQQLAAGKNEDDAARAVVDSIQWDDTLRRALFYTQAPDPVADAEQRKTLVTELWRASNEHRSVLLNCDSYPFRSSSEHEYLSVGAALLNAWACDTFVRRADAPDKNAELLVGEVYGAFRRVPTYVSVEDALGVICGGEDRAVFIGIDAGHKARNLQALVQDLYQPLVAHGQQVYALVSVRMVGRRDTFEQELQRYFRMTHIRLPLLTIDHMQAIVRHVLVAPPPGAAGGAGGGALRADDADMTVGALACSTKLAMALWWLGGTPGMLSQFLGRAAQAAAEAAAGSAIGAWGRRECTWAELRRYLVSASMPAVMGIVAAMAKHDDDYSYHHFRGASYAAILSLAVSERPVRRDQVLDGKTYTVADAETNEFLHWQEIGDRFSSAGVVRIIPLLLLASGRGPHKVIGDVIKNVASLRSDSAVCSTQALVAAALLHKYRAAHTCGATAMPLSELGFPAAADSHIGGKRVQVSASVPDLGSDGGAAPSPGDNIVACLLFKRPVPAWTICAPTSAAAVADSVRVGHMRATIHVQGDTAGASAAAPAAAAAHALTADVTAEYHKVAPVLAADAERGVPSLFLFVADKPPPPTPLPAELRGAHVVAAPHMMGALLTTLRAFTPLWPALMNTTPAALELANSPAPPALVAVLASSMWQSPA